VKWTDFDDVAGGERLVFFDRFAVENDRIPGP